MIDLSIIIVNWNSAAYILKCVESIYANTHEIQFEIIVVDNASPNCDADQIVHRFPKVVLIESSVNLGFARANNLGFRASRGRFVVFLNPDTLLINPAFDLMLLRIGSLPDVGAVGCKLLNRDQSVQTSAIQTFPAILNQLLDLDLLRNRFPACPLWNIAPLYDDSMLPSRVEAISGACVMLRREVFAQVGQFSEEFFMYAEDLDLCYKTARAGLVNYYIPQGQVIHYGGTSSVPRRAVLMKWRSILKYIAKYRGYGYQLAFRVAIASSAIARLVVLIPLMAARKSVHRHAARGTFIKWWLILQTMLTYFERNPQSESFTAEGAQGR